jgi:hypothetical protein
MKNIFTAHPNSIGETYLQHLKFASQFGGYMLLAGCACTIHAIFPFIFKDTGSTILLKMTHRFIDRMPHVEDRTLSISRLIEKKLEKTAS